MTDKVLIFGKDAWPYTRAAREAYARKGFSVEYVNVRADKARLADMLKHSQDDRRVPVIIDSGKVIIGFDGGS